MKQLFLVFFICLSSFVFAQELPQKAFETEFNYSLVNTTLYDREEVSIIECDGCVFYPEEDLFPRFEKKIKIEENYDYDVKLEVLEEEKMPSSWKLKLDVENLPNAYNLTPNVTYYRKKPILKYSNNVVRRSESGEVFLLKKASYKFKKKSTSLKSNSSRNGANSFKSSSVLASGTWYKFGVTQTGMYKLERSFLKDLGIDVENLNPNQIRVFGNGGAMLRTQNSSPRVDDLEEIAIQFFGDENGKFDADEFFAFYGQGPHVWEFNSNQQRFRHRWNLFADTNYYFISVDYNLGAPKRVQSITANATANTQVTTFNDHDFYERDLTNLVKSGKIWFGEQIGTNPTANFNFQFPNVVTSETGLVEGHFAVRSLNVKSTIQIGVTGTGSAKDTLFGEVYQGYDLPFATTGVVSTNFYPNGANLNVFVNLNKAVSNAQAWVDYIEVHVKRRLQYVNEALFFRDISSLNSGLVEYRVSSPPQNLNLWDITDHQTPQRLLGKYSNGNYFFSASTNDLKEFVVFVESDLNTPQVKIGVIENQNLHALDQVDYLIVTHPKFLAQAEDLAEFHRVNDSMSVHTVTVEKIYNEFSSGKQDITAIKDFVRMFYERAGQDSTLFPKYLLLFGDASYDYKTKSASNSNYVPTYQSNNSTTPTTSYVSDDFFGLLDPNEGEGISDLLDIGIGRFPVRTVEEAKAAVAKTKGYYAQSTLGPWRNMVTFCGDDEEGYVSLIHMRDADKLAQYVDTNYEDYHLQKIYFDAYKQESTPGGKRYPEVNKAINQRVQNGALIVNYVGHGGELGWAHERVLEVPDINQWTNKNKLPLFVTATCEFTRFDDFSRTSAGEYVFLNPDGGGIGLLTTTRLVFSTPNFQLSQEFNKIAFEKINNRRPRMGDLNRITKFNGPLSVNTRCFSLIGDPAVKLAYPTLNVVTTSVPDTMKALQKVTVKGFVAGFNMQKLTEFNGVVFSTVYAQKEVKGTLNNDGNGVFKYEDQNKIVFNGRASVKNGDFEFSFVVPKDINIDYSQGKVLFYAHNTVTDANGAYEAHQIGGVAENFAEDNKGPDINLYLNDENFAFGGVTNQTPILMADLFDEKGINTVGMGLGHDIVAILDENTSNPIVLNDFYESEIDSYQSGKVRYQLPELEEGNHTLTLKAWDVYNNSGETTLDFVVSKNEDLTISNLLNYPNPFTTNTGFYFDHNQPGQSLQVRLQVFTVSGKLVKTIDGFYYSNGFRTGPIAWDGRDDFGDKIGRGVYIYKLKVKTPTGKFAEKFQKLVILN